jgi:hypothetical protein
MVDVRITLSGIWVATMLTYLLGDVMRIFAGDFVAGEMGGESGGQWMWIVASLVMLVPIVMVVLSLVVPYPAIRWITIVVALLLILFNIVGLPYDGMYDNILIGVSFIFNAAAIYYAWTWTSVG